MEVEFDTLHPNICLLARLTDLYALECTIPLCWPKMLSVLGRPSRESLVCQGLCGSMMAIHFSTERLAMNSLFTLCIPLILSLIPCSLSCYSCSDRRFVNAPSPLASVSDNCWSSPIEASLRICNQNPTSHYLCFTTDDFFGQDRRNNTSFCTLAN